MYLAGTFSQKYKGIHWSRMTKWHNGKHISITSNVTDGSATFFFFFFPQIADTYTQHTDLTVRQRESLSQWRSNPRKGAPDHVNSFSVSAISRRAETSPLKCVSFQASHQSRSVLALLEVGQNLKKTPFPSVFQSLDNKSVTSFCLQKNKTGSLVHHHSRCSVAACILPKIVILLHVLHICCSEFSEVLGATIVHIVW